MRFSKFYAPTTKEAPKDASLPSHIFLVRGGFVEQIGSGLYNFLPLGKMMLDKITKVVKEEMDAAGVLEVSFSVVTSGELWKQSGRFNVFGKELLRFKDRKENDFVLSPTNEEAAVALVRGKVTSYKQLPLNIYQINTKFRDEARPRFGLLRGREFTMKDAYSFHANEADMKREFDLMEATYSKIFTRLGLNFRAVEADSGAIGGSGSKEFMVLAKNGEDDILCCDSCKYAANVEAAKRAKKTSDAPAPQADATKFYTPDAKTIKAVAEFFKVDEFYTIKAVIKKAIYEDTQKIVAFFVRGNDELQETKAQNACGALELVDASEDEVAAAGLVAGFCGPVGLSGVDFYIDNELKGQTQMICGANEKDYHFVGVSVSSFNDERFKDLVSVQAGDICPKCGGKLELSKGIEVGHIFQLGYKYSSAMGATFLDENGKARPFLMGCYGIGVSRLIAVMVEASHDDRGCVWKKECTPFECEIVISNLKDEAGVKFATKLYENLRNLGLCVLLDDRNERFGVKMNDFELLGFPYAIIVGKGLENGEVELITRDGLVKEVVKKDEILSVLKEKLC
ncbi:proline--tRNA ligase [Campylobacter curvus]|uniref:Proline--tRNA ligase n=1 Tax=Campylobacter curvus (strain 525.92) TaxID=360105 RepID=SYP_CAMC5|nr:proline--tRNA ligase [Campylobacter curvus]A7GYU6.1 RecName: Full=Proline--tRNA ligase; AltName: Full=Prolyl-tRNA synthetase; Short=ProRS [Campylobacter curvus 525.92]EAT99950.1 prolyl-tRNA synthetase [Campylobacter curvus 525.92]